MTDRLRILVAHSRYQSGPVSGENRVVDDEVALLRSAGHDVEIVDPRARNGSRLDLVRNGIDAVWSRETVTTLRQKISHHRPHVVHAHNLFPALSPAVFRTTRAFDVPMVATLHNYRLLCLPGTFLRQGRCCEVCLGRLPWRGVTGRCFRDSVTASGSYAASLALHRLLGSFRDVDLYLAVSNFVRSKYVEAGFSPDKVTVKHNFSWPALRRSGPGKYFLYLGRLSEEKGVDTLLAGWRLNYGELRIVGDGPAAVELRRSAPAGVRFTGPVSGDDALLQLREARALLLPSRSFEGLPRTVVEAAASGVPVVASRWGALPEAVVPGRSGILVQLDDIRAWRGAVEELLEDETSMALGDGARSEWVARFSPEQSLRALEGAYERVMRAGSARHFGPALPRA